MRSKVPQILTHVDHARTSNGDEAKRPIACAEASLRIKGILLAHLAILHERIPKLIQNRAESVDKERYQRGHNDIPYHDRYRNTLK